MSYKNNIESLRKVYSEFGREDDLRFSNGEIRIGSNSNRWIDWLFITLLIPFFYFVFWQAYNNSFLTDHLIVASISMLVIYALFIYYSLDDNILTVNYSMKSMSIKSRSIFFKVIPIKQISFPDVKEFKIKETQGPSGDSDNGSTYRTIILVKNSGWIKINRVIAYPENEKRLALELRNFLNVTLNK